MSPPTNTTIPWQLWQDTITTWAANSGLQVVWAKQSENPPQVRKPYVLLDLVTVARRGQADGVHFEQNEDTGVLEATIYGTRRLLLNVQVVANASGKWADSAFAWAEELNNDIDTDPALRPFVEAGLSICDVGPVRDLGAFEQSQFISRATFDVTLEGGIARTGSFNVEPIERVVGSGNVDENPDTELTFDVDAE